MPLSLRVWGGLVFGAVLFTFLVLSHTTFTQALRSINERLTFLEWTSASSTQKTLVEDVVPTLSPQQEGLPAALRAGRASPWLPVFFRERTLGEGEREALMQADSFAIALTSDGWLVLPARALSEGRKLTDLRIGWKGKLLSPTRGVRDRSTDLLFLQVSDSNLPAAALVPKAEFERGLPLWIESTRGAYMPAHALMTAYQGSAMTVRSSDTWNKYLLLDREHTMGAVWDARGRLVGLLDGKQAGYALPAEAIRTALTSLLEQGKILRPSLGWRYVDVTDTFSLAPNALPERGALLAKMTSSTQRLLREGDLLERIERDVLDESWSLAEQLFAYTPGATVQMSGVRDGKPFSVEVRLGERVVSESL